MTRGQSAHSVDSKTLEMMTMNKVQVDAEWLERVTVDVSEVTAAVREIADQARALKTLLDDAKLREQAVRNLHRELHLTSSAVVICNECMSDWPCATIEALEGDDE